MARIFITPLFWTYLSLIVWLALCFLHKTCNQKWFLTIFFRFSFTFSSLLFSVGSSFVLGDLFPCFVGVGWCTLERLVDLSTRTSPLRLHKPKSLSSSGVSGTLEGSSFQNHSPQRAHQASRAKRESWSGTLGAVRILVDSFVHLFLPISHLHPPLSCARTFSYAIFSNEWTDKHTCHTVEWKRARRSFDVPRGSAPQKFCTRDL